MDSNINFLLLPIKYTSCIEANSRWRIYRILIEIFWHNLSETWNINKSFINTHSMFILLSIQNECQVLWYGEYTWCNLIFFVLSVNIVSSQHTKPTKLYSLIIHACLLVSITSIQKPLKRRYGIKNNIVHDLSIFKF
jgi:hypothetical protein